MSELLVKILAGIAPKLGDAIIALCSAISVVFGYLARRKDTQDQKEKEAEQKEYEEAVDKVVDNGTLDDLLDLKKKKHE